MAGKEKYTPEQMADALHKSKGLIYIAAEQLGCAFNTVLRYIRLYALVRNARDMERGKFVDVGELKLYQAVQNGEPWAVAMVLKTLGKDRGYVERHEETGKDGEAIKISVEYVNDWRKTDNSADATSGTADSP